MCHTGMFRSPLTLAPGQAVPNWSARAHVGHCAMAFALSSCTCQSNDKLAHVHSVLSDRSCARVVPVALPLQVLSGVASLPAGKVQSQQNQR